MAAPSYDIDVISNEVTPNSALFNRNASGIATSSTLIATPAAIYEQFYQQFSFTILRQDIIIPNGSFTDPNVTVSANAAFPGIATHNRILVNGNANLNSFFITSANLAASSIRVPQTFLAYGSASGVSGNGLYTTGTGWIPTYQGGFTQAPITASSVEITRNINFTFPIYLRSNRWATFSISDPVNEIIREVARELRSRYIPELKLDLLFV